MSKEAITDDDLRDIWRSKGGRFHGPKVETGTMPEHLLLPFLREALSQQGEPVQQVNAELLGALIQKYSDIIYDGAGAHLAQAFESDIKALIEALAQPAQAAAMPSEIALMEKLAKRVGITSLLNNGAASCVFSEGCNGVSQSHLLAYTREVALHCAVALAAPQPPQQGEPVVQCWKCGDSSPEFQKACTVEYCGMREDTVQPPQQGEPVTIEAQKVPDGRQLVPDELTREMWAAVNKVDDSAFAGGSMHGADFESLWDAALASAPPAPQASVKQEPVAWRTFDGEGSYEYRTHDDNETYAEQYAKRNPRHVGWVEPLYTHPAPAQQPLSEELRAIGGQMANVCFNWSQQANRIGALLSEEEREMLGDLRKQWDSAISTKRAHGIGGEK